jgi:AraC-like DNA-binding protein
MAQAGLDYASSQEFALIFYFADQFFTTALIPLAFIYIKHEESFNKGNKLLLSWIAIPVTLLFAELIMYRLCDKEVFAAYIFNQAHNATAESPDRILFYFDICSRHVYTAILTLGSLFFAIRTAVLQNRLSLKPSIIITLLASIYTVNSVLTNILHIDHTIIRIIWAILMSIAVFMLSYNGSHLSDFISETSSAMNSAQPFPSVKDSHDTNDTSETSRLTRPDFHVPAAQQDQINENSLRIRFENLIIKNRYFLIQGITLSDIAKELGTNRTYVSRMINNSYDISFTDYINTLRIDYAQKYLLQHKDAKQSEIAAACGFPNASTFNNIFRKKTGVTPKIWVATNS